jgi:SAM-dependent methyltransferase
METRLEVAIDQLKAVAEESRLRILAVCAQGELSVTEITRILGQSQPRVSRHLKVLLNAGLLLRFRERHSVLYVVVRRGAEGRLIEQALSMMPSDDPLLQRDQARLNEIRAERARSAASYLRFHAEDWHRLLDASFGSGEFNRAVLDAVTAARGGDLGELLDIGTGTGRILELFADRDTKGLGFDTNQAMLAYARSRLENAGLSHAQVRHGDLYNLPLDNGSCDAIVVHQVLHFLTSPAAAFAEFARVLAPHGRLLLVDFAPHDLAFLREQHAHRLLGVSMDDLDGWMRQTDLVLTGRKSFAPSEPSTEHLTVNLWLIQTQQATASRLRVRRGNLEITS